MFSFYKSCVKLGYKLVIGCVVLCVFVSTGEAKKQQSIQSVVVKVSKFSIFIDRLLQYISTVYIRLSLVLDSSYTHNPQALLLKEL
jgi:hypothetical protein